MKRWEKNALIGAAAGTTAFAAGELTVFLIAFRGRVYHDITKDGELMIPKFRPYRERILDSINEINNRKCEYVTIDSRDGLKLTGRFYAHSEPRGILLLCHGYRSVAENDFCCAFQELYNMGFSIMLIDQRAHGRSEGRIITFGIKERHDVRGWLEYLADRFPDTPIIAEGISMGAATVLMAAGDPLPENVAGLILDCGYASPKEELKYVLRRSHLPSVPLYPMARLSGKALAGFDLEECSPEEAAAKCRLPALFIHGEADRLVPLEMGKRCYEAYAGPKRLVTVPGAGHGMSYLVDTEKVSEALRTFIDNTVPGNTDHTDP